MDHSLWDNALNNAVGNLGLCGKLLETIDKNVAEEFMDRFKNCVEEYCKLDIVHKSTLAALKETTKYYANEENDLNVHPKKIFDRFYKDTEKPNKTNVENHELQGIYMREIQGDDGENDTNMEDDDDIISTNQFVPPTDPISKEPIKNPVRNLKCGHIYDKDTIMQMIAQKPMRCPYIGCPSRHYVTQNQLENDHELKRKIDSHYLNE